MSVARVDYACAGHDRVAMASLVMTSQRVWIQVIPDDGLGWLRRGMDKQLLDKLCWKRQLCKFAIPCAIIKQCMSRARRKNVCGSSFTGARNAAHCRICCVARKSAVEKRVPAVGGIVPNLGVFGGANLRDSSRRAERLLAFVTIRDVLVRCELCT